MVTLAPASSASLPRTAAWRERGVRFWALWALGVVVLGATTRLVISGTGVGDRSAVVMLGLLAAGAWAAVNAALGPRAALLVVLGVTVLFDLAALPVRNAPPYDDLQAFYGTDQVLAAQVPVAGDASVVTVLAQPVFDGSVPRFGLAGDVNGAAVAWTCAFERGLHELALPLPGDALRGATLADVRLHLTGSPARDGDYLVVYKSSRVGGFVLSVSSAGSIRSSATRCALA